MRKSLPKRHLAVRPPTDWTPAVRCRIPATLVHSGVNLNNRKLELIGYSPWCTDWTSCAPARCLAISVNNVHSVQLTVKSLLKPHGYGRMDADRGPVTTVYTLDISVVHWWPVPLYLRTWAGTPYIPALRVHSVLHAINSAVRSAHLTVRARRAGADMPDRHN